MNFKEINLKFGRYSLIIITILVWMYIVWSFFANGYIETWYKWYIPAKMPPFVDFRMIPSAAEAFRSGSGPTFLKEYVFNYPKVWYLVFYTGITQADTIWIVVILLVLFFAIVFAFPEKLHVVDSLLMLPVIFSPAAVLLYERGNVDLVFFILCGLAVLLVRRFPWRTVVVLLVGSFFKIFPIFGVGIFLRENKQNFYKYVVASILIFGLYIVLSYKELSSIWNLTMRGTYLSYGDYVIPYLYHAYFRYYLLRVMTEEQIVLFMKILPHLVALSVLAIAFWLGTKSKNTLEDDSERNLTAFRMGALIYIGTFLLGNNWDYRLSFLIFTIPQISRWIFSSNKTIKMLIATIFIAMLTSCWYTALLRCFSVITDGADTLIYNTFDEMMNWILFAGLAYLLALTTPLWVRTYSWNPYVQEKAT